MRWSIVLALATVLIPGLFPDLASAQDPESYVRAEDRQLVVGADDTPIRLRGVNIGAIFVVTDDRQWILDDFEDRGEPEYERVTEDHFRQLSELGFNCLRYNLSYRYFERHGRPGVYDPRAWAMVDRAVAWAKEHDLWLILDLHVTAGGNQPSGGGGWRLWEDAAVQQRTIDLWQAIARRYRDETIIAGYDLINEPNPTRSAQQWKVFSGRLIEAIREVDPHHMIVLEQVNWIVNRHGESPNLNEEQVAETFLFPVDDDNVLYDVHMYAPLAYTHQLVSWGNYPEYGRYPNRRRVRGAAHEDLGPLNRQFLQRRMARWIRFSQEHEVPLNVGELGPGPPCFGENRNGIGYVRDLLAILDHHQVNYQYYCADWIFPDQWHFENKPYHRTMSRQLQRFFSEYFRELDDE